MIVRIAAFTAQGRKTSYRIGAVPCFDRVNYYDKEKTSLKDWTREGFQEKEAIIFVGAVGIAVRTIAPFIESKLSDSPVIVVDELGANVIPVLSGHVGGANEIARLIADYLGAKAIITTATDLNDAFSVDVFAAKNDLFIANKPGIQKVSSKVLAGEKISVSWDQSKTFFDRSKLPEDIVVTEYPPKDYVDLLIINPRDYTGQEDESCFGLLLVPKTKVLGMGCKKGKSVDEIEALVSECSINFDQVYAVASIDVKKDEEGLIQFAGRHRLKFITYPKEQLLAVPGDFTSSEFVKNTVGVDNVCERSALCCAGEGSVLIQKKTAKDGVTLAVAEKRWEN